MWSAWPLPPRLSLASQRGQIPRKPLEELKLQTHDYFRCSSIPAYDSCFPAGKFLGSTLVTALTLGILTAVSLSVLPEDLASRSSRSLLYVSLSVLSFTYPALVDSGSSISLIHPALVSLLGLTVTPCDGPYATLADGKTSLVYTGYVLLSYTLAGSPLSDYFFVAPIGAQSFLLGMPFLERENPRIDWRMKTLELQQSTSPEPDPHLSSCQSSSSDANTTVVA